MANNKVQLSDGTVLLDLTGDTVTPDTLLEGFTAHGKDGAPIVGTLTVPTASIKVTGLSQSDTVTAAMGSKTKTATWVTDGSCWLIDGIRDFGTWTVTATNGTQTATQDVLVDVITEYEITMAYRFYLYNEGDECEDVTGGWVSTPIQSTQRIWDFGNTTKTKNPDSLQISSVGPSSVGSFYTANKIPIGEYSKLMAAVDFANGGTIESTILWLQLWEVTPAGQIFRTSRELLYTPTETSGSIILGLPISDSAGEFYILIGNGNISSTSWTCDAKFKTIWLE